MSFATLTKLMKGYCGLGLFSELDHLIEAQALQAKPLFKQILENTIFEMSHDDNLAYLPIISYCLSKGLRLGKAKRLCQEAPRKERGEEVMKLLESEEVPPLPPSPAPPITLDYTNRQWAFDIVLNLYKLGFMKALVRMIEVYKIPVDVYNGNNDWSLPLELIDFEGDNGKVDSEGLRFCVAQGASLYHLNFVSSFVFRNPEIPLEDYKEALKILVQGGISLGSVFSTAVHKGSEYVDYLFQAYGDKINPCGVKMLLFLGGVHPSKPSYFFWPILALRLISQKRRSGKCLRMPFLWTLTSPLASMILFLFWR